MPSDVVQKRMLCDTIIDGGLQSREPGGELMRIEHEDVTNPEETTIVIEGLKEPPRCCMSPIAI